VTCSRAGNQGPAFLILACRSAAQWACFLFRAGSCIQVLTYFSPIHSFFHEIRVTTYDIISIMPSTKSSTGPSPAWKFTTSLFLLNILPITALNPSEFSPSNIRRRSGSLDRPAHWGPVRKRDGGVPLVVMNQCAETLWPGIGTQAGTGPGTGGFELKSGDTKEMTVSADWQGRVWGRTNCSFNALGTGASNLNGNNGAGRACTTGDCGGVLSCVLTVSSSSFLL
jgi:hypothetical protein